MLTFKGQVQVSQWLIFNYQELDKLHNFYKCISSLKIVQLTLKLPLIMINVEIFIFNTTKHVNLARIL